jgi:glycosyltransferase involved in cell wall biosynthesis
MDVFTFASHSEGSPNAVLEAMATALPIVATRIDGVIDLLEGGRTGILVPCDDSGSLAISLSRLLGDADLRAELGRRARARAVEAYSLPNAISRLIDVYIGLQNRTKPYSHRSDGE